MKYFYVLVVDDYPYYKVTDHRYKNEIDFYYSILSENFKEVAECDYDDPYDYFDSVDRYPTTYVAIDENENELDNLEDPKDTFMKIKDKLS